MFQDVIEGLIYAVFGTIAFCVLIIFPIFMFGPSFESKFFPVLEDMIVTDVGTDPNSNYSHYVLSYKKVRFCEPVPETRAWYILQSRKDPTRVSVVSTNKAESDISLPIGNYSSNIWDVDNKRFGPVQSQRLVVTYNCHPFWLTQTTINIPIGLDK